MFCGHGHHRHHSESCGGPGSRRGDLRDRAGGGIARDFGGGIARDFGGGIARDCPAPAEVYCDPRRHNAAALQLEMYLAALKDEIRTVETDLAAMSAGGPVTADPRV